MKISSILKATISATPHKTSETKGESYATTKLTASTVRDHVYKTLKASKTPMSRREIAEAANISLQSVCGRVSELMNEGKIVSVDKQKDEETNRNVETLKAI